MARKVNQISEGDEAAEGNTHGGGPGIVPGATTELSYPGAVSGSAAREERPEAHTVKKYIVTNPGGIPIMYGSVRTTLQQNKILDENAYDLDMLRRQGVQLREVG